MEESESQTRGQRTLRESAREVILAGKLPARGPDRVWGGRGDGAACSICNAPVKQDEVEFELEFVCAADPTTHHLHADCFAAWESERTIFEHGEDDLQQSA